MHYKKVVKRPCGAGLVQSAGEYLCTESRHQLRAELRSVPGRIVLRCDFDNIVADQVQIAEAAQ